MEIILVNDASPDASWACMKQLAEADPRIKAINLSRNFGQHFAITAGLSYAKGEWIAVMDCDLQDVPEELPKLYRKALEGYDAVFGRRAVRQDHWQKRWTSLVFIKMLSWLACTSIDPAIANYSVISSRVVAAVLQMKERHRSYGMLVHLATSKIASIDIEHAARPYGESSYTFTRKLRLAADLVISHSIRPLYVSVFVGFGFSAIGFLGILYLMARYFLLGIAVAGWASTIVSIWLVGGAMMFSQAILGLYLGKVLEQAKERPLFLVAETLNLDNRNPELATRETFLH
jgi:dolichol-phosphate mannosyltransferase